MARQPAPLIPLGYGKYARADRIYALVPLIGGERGDGRRTLVHIEGIDDPVVASRSDAAIAHDVSIALGHRPADLPAHHDRPQIDGQESLFP